VTSDLDALPGRSLESAGRNKGRRDPAFTRNLSPTCRKQTSDPPPILIYSGNHEMNRCSPLAHADLRVSTGNVSPPGTFRRSAEPHLKTNSGGTLAAVFVVEAGGVSRHAHHRSPGPLSRIGGLAVGTSPTRIPGPESVHENKARPAGYDRGRRVGRSPGRSTPCPNTSAPE
jgi:hypothetical protein